MDVVLLLILWAFVIGLYWAPTGVAFLRKTDNIAQVAVLNFFGFTGVFWVVALVFALKPDTTTAQPHTTNVTSVRHDPEEWGKHGSERD